MPHRILQRQLDLVGLSLDTPPDADNWNRFLTALNQDLRHHSEQQSLYQAFFNQSHDAVAVLDLAGNVVDVNDRMINLMKYESPAEVIGQPVHWFARPGEEQSNALRRLKYLLEGGQSILFERELMRNDGSIITVEGYGELVKDDDQTVRFVMVVIRDITHRKTFEKELSRSESLMNDLLTNIPVGVLAQDANAKIVFSNPAAYEVLGLTEDQFLGRTSFDPEWNVIREDGSDFPGPEHPAAVALATHQPVKDVLMGVYRPRTSDRAWILVNALPQRDNEAGIEVLVTFNDITERRKAAEQARELKMQQVIADRSSHLVESIGHDFRTPLSVISTSTYLLKRKTAGNTSLMTHIDMLEAQAQRLNWLVDEAMLMSHLDNGLIKLGQVMNNINLVAREVIRKLEPQFVAKTQYVRIELGDKLPKVALDWQYLSIAIEHLLLNASQHSPANSAIRVSSQQNSDYIEVSIEDQGPGLSEEEQSQVFERLYKVNKARTDGGSGLGLPITKEIMKLHGGSISVKSTPGKGCAFTLSLPLAVAAE
jgi:PAS domain S-box-containing protein